jgi:hypothetical protein
MNLERICLVFQDTQANLLQSLQELINSRPGMLYDSKATSEHIEITTLIRIFLSTPSAHSAVKS